MSQRHWTIHEHPAFRVNELGAPSDQGNAWVFVQETDMLRKSIGDGDVIGVLPCHVLAARKANPAIEGMG